MSYLFGQTPVAQNQSMEAPNSMMDSYQTGKMAY